MKEIFIINDLLKRKKQKQKKDKGNENYILEAYNFLK